MVEGIQLFRDKFKNYTDCYTIIGGAACDILMNEANIEFRATKDIDMILLLESQDKEFAKVFWEYIKEGCYKCGWRNSHTTHFYRFTEPKRGYPIMIELFSRKQGYPLKTSGEIIPIHIDDNISSLSAILLNDDFYNFMLNGRKIVNNISILRAEYLIPFKMYAWLELTKHKADGKHVNNRDLKKHKNDVFRLLQIVNTDSKVETDGLVNKVIHEFFVYIQKESIRLQQLGLPFDMTTAMELLGRIYGIS